MKRIVDAVRQATEAETNCWAMYLSLERLGSETRALINDASIMALAERFSGSTRRTYQARAES